MKTAAVFKNIDEIRRTIKILDMTLANCGETNVGPEEADELDDWVSEMYETIKTRAMAAR